MTAHPLLAFGLAALLLPAFTTEPAPVPAPAPVARFHCQVPCGIYGDTMRIESLREDAATIRKGMGMLETADLDMNQTVRWIMTKDEHAQSIQDQIAGYWLAQRIKLPAPGSDATAQARYVQQLGLLHQVIVSAMKCKQTTDEAHVDALLGSVEAFGRTYFTEADLEHLREHGDR